MSLLCCPCCGSCEIEREQQSSIFKGQNYSDRYPSPAATQNKGHKVRCNNCGVQTCWWHFQVEAESSWNKRVDKEE